MTACVLSLDSRLSPGSVNGLRLQRGLYFVCCLSFGLSVYDLAHPSPHRGIRAQPTPSKPREEEKVSRSGNYGVRGKIRVRQRKVTLTPISPPTRTSLSLRVLLSVG